MRGEKMVYVNDLGIRNVAVTAVSDYVVRDSAQLGRVVESVVADYCQRLKYDLEPASELQTFYWRSQGYETDIVIELFQKAVPVEKGEFAYTVIWIMAMDQMDRWRLLNVRKFDEKDPMKQVATIGKLLDLYNVKQAVADISYGVVQVSELQKRFASRVLGCQYVRNPAVSLERRSEDQDGRKITQMVLNAD